MNEEERTYEIFTLQNESYEKRSFQVPFESQRLNTVKSANDKSTIIKPKESHIGNRKEKDE